MNEQAYELTSLAMRYWFALLMLLAVLCALRLYVVDRRRARRERRAAPNMEFVGELLVVKGAGEITRGERYAVQRDAVIGRRRKCDVCLSDRSVFPRHARAELRTGGMLFSAIGRAPVALKGQPLAQEVLVRDGALVCIGALTLQLTLYDVTVEYEVDGEGRAIDAQRVDGEDFDDEYAPFEHEFDGEYGGDGADDAAPDDADEQYDAAPEPEPPKRRERRAREFAPPDIREYDDLGDMPDDAPDGDPDELPDYEPDDADYDDDKPTRGRRS